MRIVIAEDSAVIRAGLAEILADRGHEVVAAVGDAEALKAAVAEHKPDVAIVDVRMPPDHTDEGLRAAIAIRRDHPGTSILVFSQYVETRYAADLLSMRSGGVGYLLKDRVANVGEFTDAIARVAAGGTALDPEVVTGLLNASRHASALSALTARERDVLALMAEGRSNSAIAGQLMITDRAVEKHISNIFSKLGLPPSDSDHRRVLAVLAGPSGSGKSAWAAERYRPDEVVSSDRLRALVGSGEHDLDASDDAFALLDQIVAARLRRGLTAVVDTLGLEAARRRGYLELARSSGMPAVVVLVDTDSAECRRRNRARDRAVPAAVLEGQLRRMRTAAEEVRGEGWDLVTTAGPVRPEASHTPGAGAAASAQRQRPARMGLVLQLSRFPWDEDPQARRTGWPRWPAPPPRPACRASR